jgi:hypothetical protein
MEARAGRGTARALRPPSATAGMPPLSPSRPQPLPGAWRHHPSSSLAPPLPDTPLQRRPARLLPPPAATRGSSGAGGRRSRAQPAPEPSSGSTSTGGEEIGGYTPADYITYSDDPRHALAHAVEVQADAPLGVCVELWSEWAGLVEFCDLIGKVGLDPDLPDMALLFCYYRWGESLWVFVVVEGAFFFCRGLWRACALAFPPLPFPRKPKHPFLTPPPPCTSDHHHPPPHSHHQPNNKTAKLPVMELSVLLRRNLAAPPSGRLGPAARRIAFESEHGMPLRGDVEFAEAPDGRTRVALRAEHPLPSLLALLGVAPSAVEAHVASLLAHNLSSFAALARARAPPGTWDREAAARRGAAAAQQQAALLKQQQQQQQQEEQEEVERAAAAAAAARGGEAGARAGAGAGAGGGAARTAAAAAAAAAPAAAAPAATGQQPRRARSRSASRGGTSSSSSGGFGGAADDAAAAPAPPTNGRAPSRRSGSRAPTAEGGAPGRRRTSTSNISSGSVMARR